MTTSDEIIRELASLAKQRRAIDEKQNALSDEYIAVVETGRRALAGSHDGWMHRAKDAEAALDKARAEVKSLTDRVSALSTSFGSSGLPSAAVVGAAAGVEGAVTTSAPAVALSDLRVAVAVALVVLDGVHTLDAYHAAKGLRDAMGGT